MPKCEKDWLDSDEFKTLMKEFWNGLPWHNHVDEVRDAIRANYKPKPSRRIRELEEWVDKLTGEKR